MHDSSRAIVSHYLVSVKPAPVTPVPAATLVLLRNRSAAAFEVLLIRRHTASKFAAGDFVFPGGKPGRPLSTMALQMLLRRMKIAGATAHGFRSAFRDWAGDRTDHPRDVVEAALAHLIENKVEAAYRRGDLFAKLVVSLPDRPDPRLESFAEEWRRDRPYAPRRRS